MIAFRAAHAAGAPWHVLATSCLAQLAPLPDGANLGFVYVTDTLADDLTSILTFLRERTRAADWIGSVGVGICASGIETFEKPGLAIMLAALPDASFRVFAPIAGDFERFTNETAAWLAERPATLAIVHGDPREPSLAQVLGTLAARSGAFLVGGLSSARDAPLQIAGRVVEGGLSGVLLASQISVATGLTQGCSPIGPTHLVTEAEDNIVMAIDGRPALDVFKDDIGELLSRDLRRVAGLVFAGLPVTGSDCRRDAPSAITDLKRMLAGLKRRAGGAAKAGLYYSCVARGPNLFGDDSEELSLVRDALGDFPLVGFFGNGEISSDRLYTYTAVLTLFL